MTVKNTIHTAILVSGFALASSFSIGPSVTATTHCSRNTNTLVVSQSSCLPQVGVAVAVAPSNRMSVVLHSTESSSEIDLLDEVNSIFDCIDTNGDGSITQDELKAHLVDEMGYSKKYTEYLFESIDTDSDGSISRDELRFAFYNFEALSMYMTFGLGGADMTKQESFKKLALQSALEYYDANDDDEKKNSSKLLLDDLADLIFDMIDTDQSGEITKEELKAHFGSVTDKLATNPKEKASKQQAQEYVQTMFQTLDADSDGNICREEIRAAFGKYDFKLLARTFGLKVYRSAEV